MGGIGGFGGLISSGGGLDAAGLDLVSGLGEGGDKACVESAGDGTQSAASQQGALASAQFSAGVLQGLLETAPCLTQEGPPPCIEPVVVEPEAFEPPMCIEPAVVEPEVFEPPMCIEPVVVEPVVVEPEVFEPPMCIEPLLPPSIRELEEAVERGDITDVYGDLDPGKPVEVRDLPATPSPTDSDPQGIRTPRIPGREEPLIDNPGPELLREIQRNRLQASLQEPLPSEGELAGMSPGQLYALEQKILARQSARSRLHEMSAEELGGPFVGGVTPESIAESRLLAAIRERLTIDAI